MSLIEYCHAKNIPFTEHEQRYYEIMRNKQNHKYWVDSWRKYCDHNIVEPSPKKEESSHRATGLIKALMNMANKKQTTPVSTDSSGKGQQEPNPARHSLSLALSHKKTNSQIVDRASDSAASKPFSGLSHHLAGEEFKVVTNRRYQAKLERLLDQPVKVDDKPKKRIRRRRQTNYYK